MKIVVALSSTGRPLAMNLRDDSTEPTLPGTGQRAAERPWRNSGNGVMFFPSQGRSRWAARAHHWGLALLAVTMTFALALLTLAVAYALQ